MSRTSRVPALFAARWGWAVLLLPAVLLFRPLTQAAASSGPIAGGGSEGPRADTVRVTLREGTNMSLALAPDGRSLVTDIQGVLWSLPVEGGAARALTDYLADARQPAWSPDGQRIVFQSFRDGGWHLWTVERDGSGLRQLTTGPHDHREPHWSPDGMRVAFSSDRSWKYDVWELDVKSGALRQLTDDPAAAYGPAWSPDGTSLAFVSERAPGAGIWLRTEEGGEWPLVQVDGRLAGPSWSPDGRRLAFQRFAGAEASLWVVDVPPAGEGPAAPRRVSEPGEDVFPFRPAWAGPDELLYTADGGIRRRRLAGGPAQAVGFTAEVTLVRPRYTRRVRDMESTEPQPVRGILGPAVSPEGGRIALFAVGDLWLLEVGRPRPDALTRDPYVALDPSWSPDGTRLAFASDRGGSLDIWVRDLATGAERRVTEIPGDAEGPAWSPDGTRIAFLAEGAVQVVDVAGGTVTRLPGDVSAASHPTWSGDGRRVAVSALRPHSSRFREGVFEVVVIPVDGGEVHRFQPLPHVSVAARGSRSPVWSPDGLSMALVMGGTLWVQPVRPDGRPDGQPRRLTDELATAPSWTGDSRRIVYLATDGLRSIDVETGRVDALALELDWRRRLPEGRLVIHAGALFDGRGPELRRDVDIVVEGHRIVAVEPHSPALHTGRVVDGSGLTAMPGLIEHHGHQGSSEWQGRAFLAYGITTLREVSGHPQGSWEHIEAVESGARLGPRVFFTGSSVDGLRIFRPTVALDGGPQLERQMEQAEALAFDHIKTYVRLSDAMQARIVELAHRQGIPVTSHELFPAVAFGVDGVEHYTFTSRRGYSTKASLLLRGYQDQRELLARSGVVWTPTLAVQGGWNALVARATPLLVEERFAALYPAPVVDQLRRRAAAGDPEAELPPSLANIFTQLRGVQEAGGRLLAGTDVAPYGVTFQAELELLVMAGLTPFEALRAATALPAEDLGVGHLLGTVEVGKLADLLLVAGDPLQDVRHARDIRVVVKNGFVYSMEELLTRP